MLAIYVIDGLFAMVTGDSYKLVVTNLKLAVRDLRDCIQQELACQIAVRTLAVVASTLILRNAVVSVLGRWRRG